MDLPIRFPSQADLVYEQAQAYRRLTPTDRFLAIIDLIASGTTLMAHSPHLQGSQRLREVDEAQWQRAQKELFARHGR